MNDTVGVDLIVITLDRMTDFAALERLDGGLTASVHYHQNQYARHAQETQKALYWLKFAQFPCTVPTQPKIGMLCAMKTM